MSKTNTTPPHQVRYERDVMDLPSSSGWRERVPTANARASCTCGQLDTEYVDAEVAYRAAQDHVRRYLPGVDWGPDTDGPGADLAHDPLPRPLSGHCRPGRCLALTCCSYECSQGRCPSIPAERRKPTP